MVLWMECALKSSGLEQGVDKLLPDPARSLPGGARNNGTTPMLEYGELLRYLADNPPGSEAERRVHASMLELIATCVRDEQPDSSPDQSNALTQMRARYGEEFASRAH